MRSLLHADAMAMMAMLAMKRRRDSTPKNVATKISSAKLKISGKQRNKPCPCGSGVKGKNCICDIFDR